jgi:hypothetical protein
MRPARSALSTAASAVTLPRSDAPPRCKPLVIPHRPGAVVRLSAIASMSGRAQQPLVRLIQPAIDPLVITKSADST